MPCVICNENSYGSDICPSCTETELHRLKEQEREGKLIDRQMSSDIIFETIQVLRDEVGLGDSFMPCDLPDLIRAICKDYKKYMGLNEATIEGKKDD